MPLGHPGSVHSTHSASEVMRGLRLGLGLGPGGRVLNSWAWPAVPGSWPGQRGSTTEPRGCAGVAAGRGCTAVRAQWTARHAVSASISHVVQVIALASRETGQSRSLLHAAHRAGSAGSAGQAGLEGPARSGGRRSLGGVGVAAGSLASGLEEWIL